MLRVRTLVSALCLITLPVSTAASAARDVGPVGGSGGGEFRRACEPGDAVVGFDIQATHVITRIAPVCGDKKKGGTYGRPWVGGEAEGAVVHKPRCDPGSILTILHVFWDKSPLISKVGFTCYHPGTRQHNDHLLDNAGAAPVADRRLICTRGRIGVGVFGRAGTAIDALGLTCSEV